MVVPQNRVRRIALVRNDWHPHPPNGLLILDVSQSDPSDAYASYLLMRVLVAESLRTEF
jgi:hypothetical protein